jgi:hypothetical protein
MFVRTMTNDTSPDPTSFLAHLASLRDHGEWADRRLLESLRESAVPNAVRELAHVRGAQEIWLSRIEQRTATLPIWPGEALDAAWRSRLAALTGNMLNQEISYKNTAGEP